MIGLFLKILYYYDARVFDESGNVQDSSYLLSEYFFNAAPIINDRTFLDGIVRNFFFALQEKIDSSIDNEMWNKLFR